MSLRQVLTIYNAERQLNEDDTALLNTLRRFTEPERALLIEQLSDKPQKKPGKGRASKSSTKSQRASGMAARLGKSLQQQRKATATDDNEDDGRCAYKIGEDSGGPIICDTLVDNNVHHKRTDPDYHPFVPPAQSADGSSSASGAATSSTVSSEDAMGNALDAARAAAGE